MSERVSSSAFKELESVVDGLAYGGDGVVRIDGKAGFVPGALPGERVVVRVLQEKQRFSRYELVQIIEPSNLRRQDDCPHEGEGCGGCGFRHVGDEQALSVKTRAAMESVQRLAASVPWPEPSLHPVEDHDGQRTRIRFHADERTLGLYKRGTHELIRIPHCRSAHPRILEVAESLESLLGLTTAETSPNTVLIEIAGDMATVSWFGALGDGQRERLTDLVTDGPIAGVRVQHRGTGERLGAEWSEETIETGERPVVCTRRIGTFAQANAEANTHIQKLAVQWISALPTHRLLELYAGSGNLTLPSALACDEVLAVEMDRKALDGLRRSVEVNQLSNIQPYERDLRRGFTRKLRDYPCDAILLDPPRSGAAEVLDDIIASRAQHLLYVSCSPPHLARDAKKLAQVFDVETVDAVDMFPRTPQVELVVGFRRRPS